MDGDRMSGRVVIAGGSGFIGRALSDALIEAGFTTAILSRRGTGALQWDGATPGVWVTQLNGAVGVINLTGEPIATKWTHQKQQEIINSRVNSTNAIGNAILAVEKPPKVWINGSAVGFYGDRGDEILTEDSAPGAMDNFLVSTCVAWEEAQSKFKTPNTRQCCLRTGVVLGKDGGAFPELKKLANLFLGGKAGSGNQYMPWIHLEDIVGLFLFALKNELTGPINGTAPEPVTNEKFMSTLRESVGKKFGLNAPVFSMRLASALGATDPDVILCSQRAIPKKAMDAGYEFRFPTLAAAIEDLR